MQPTTTRASNYVEKTGKFVEGVVIPYTIKPALNAATGFSLGYLATQGLNYAIKYLPNHAWNPTPVNASQGGSVLALYFLIDTITIKAVKTLINTFGFDRDKSVEIYGRKIIERETLINWSQKGLTIVATSLVSSMAAPYFSAGIRLSFYQTGYLLAAGYATFMAVNILFQKHTENRQVVLQNARIAFNSALDTAAKGSFSTLEAIVGGYLAAPAIAAAAKWIQPSNFFKPDSLKPTESACAFVAFAIFNNITSKLSDILLTKLANTWMTKKQIERRNQSGSRYLTNVDYTPDSLRATHPYIFKAIDISKIVLGIAATSFAASRSGLPISLPSMAYVTLAGAITSLVFDRFAPVLNTTVSAAVGYIAARGLNFAVQWFPTHAWAPTLMNTTQGASAFALFVVIHRATKKVMKTLSENLNLNKYLDDEFLFYGSKIVSIVATAQAYALAAPFIANYLPSAGTSISLVQTSYLAIAGFATLTALTVLLNKASKPVNKMIEELENSVHHTLETAAKGSYSTGSALIGGLLASPAISVAAKWIHPSQMFQPGLIQPIESTCAFVAFTIFNKITRRLSNSIFIRLADRFIPKDYSGYTSSELRETYPHFFKAVDLSRLALGVVATSYAADYAGLTISLTSMAYVAVAGVISTLVIKKLRRLSLSPQNLATSAGFAATVGYLASGAVNVAVTWLPSTYMVAPSLVNPIHGAAAFTAFWAIEKITSIYLSTIDCLGFDQKTTHKLAGCAFSILATSYATTLGAPYIAPLSNVTMAYIATAGMLLTVALKTLLRHYNLPLDIQNNVPVVVEGGELDKILGLPYVTAYIAGQTSSINVTVRNDSKNPVPVKGNVKASVTNQPLHVVPLEEPAPPVSVSPPAPQRSASRKAPASDRQKPILSGSESGSDVNDDSYSSDAGEETDDDTPPWFTENLLRVNRNPLI